MNLDQPHPRTLGPPLKLRLTFRSPIRRPIRVVKISPLARPALPTRRALAFLTLLPDAQCGESSLRRVSVEDRA